MYRDPTEFNERFKEWKNGGKPYENGLPKYANGKRGHIGGSTKQARETVWNTDLVLKNAVDSIANEYLLKDGLLQHRLNEEGFTDKTIRLYNNAKNQSLYTGENLLNNKTDFSGVGDFGLDDAGTMILNNQMLLKGERWWDEEGENEQGRITHGAVGDTVRDTIGLQASALKYFSDQVKKDYPNLSDYDNARYTQAYYQRGVGGGRKWAKAGAKGYNFSTKPLAMRPAETPYQMLTTIQSTAAPKFGKYANGKLPLFRGGKYGYVRLNGNDIKFDQETGELIDLVTGERGTLMLPEINITRANPHNYRSSYDPNAAINGFNALTLGGLNNLDPTQWARRAYDLPKTLFGPMRFSTYMDRWINGNEGLVSSNFLQQHPWYSAGVNLLGGAALVGGSTLGPRIVHNIANRNQFFYKYLTPFSYDHPLKRGLNVAQKILTEPKINLPLDFIPNWMGKINNGISKGSHGTYIGYIPKDIIAKAELNGIENTPEYINYALKLSRLENKFRDAAFRKYLNLPERDPLYIANQDGTFSYNLPYIEQQYAKNGLKIDTANMNFGVDWITGNGGNLESTKNISFGHGIGSDSSKTFSMQEMTDTWDLHPFRRADDLLSKKYGDLVRKTADNIYTKLYDRLYGHNKPFKYISGYNLLGGKQLNRIRYSDKVPFQNTIDKISKKLVNFEVGPIMGGKPFIMKTNIPLTRQFTLEGESPVYRIQYGLNADNILPQSYFDWLKHGDKKIASDFELGVPF